MINQYEDFLYLAAVEFYGERGYFGHDLHTFDDCLLSIYHEKGYMNGKKVILLNAGKITIPDLLKLYEEVKEIFLRYKFSIERGIV